jgi:hypothetical protein
MALLYARNTNVYVVLVKQQDPEGRMDGKLICFSVLSFTNSCYYSVDGNLHVQGARFLDPHRRSEQG